VIVGLVSALTPDKDVPDAETLRLLGCAKIFSQDRPHMLPERVLEFLRPDDVLAVIELSQLAASIDELVSCVERLHQHGVTICAVREGIGRDPPTGQIFANICGTLAEFNRARAEELRRSKAAKLARKRGRPALLGRNDRLRAETLLKTGRASVTDVARLLGVSPATIYRHFPRRRIERDVALNEQPATVPPLQFSPEAETEE
jgi:DNA invertase Pin-like site-specific DNA recombinase